jgi:hypothetical protein
MPPDNLALPSRRSPFHEWHLSHSRFLRSLLARRLMRFGRDAEARRYFSEEEIAVLDEFELFLHRGNDSSHSKIDRGRALCAAARIMRAHGDMLRGTELEPDFVIFQGNYEYESIYSYRVSTSNRHAGPTTDEINRGRQAAVPRRRWHYRYTAAELAWRGAEMLPDNSDDTASILRDAGDWLKTNDRAAAEPFYQALIARCPNTKLGRDAKSRGWLP